MSGAIAWGAAPGGGLPSGAPYSDGAEGDSATATYGSAFFGFSSAYSGPPVTVLHAFRLTRHDEWVEQLPQTLDSTHPTGGISADALGEHVFIPTVGGYKCATPLYFDILPKSKTNPSPVFWWGEWIDFEEWGPDTDPGPAPAPRLAWGDSPYGGGPSGPPYSPGNAGVTEVTLSSAPQFGLVGVAHSGEDVFDAAGLDVRIRFYPQDGGAMEWHSAGGGYVGNTRFGDGNGTYKVTMHVAGRLTSPMLVATIMLSEEGYGTVAWYEAEPEGSAPYVGFWTLLRNAEETP